MTSVGQVAKFAFRLKHERYNWRSGYWAASAARALDPYQRQELFQACHPVIVYGRLKLVLFCKKAYN